jgi:hypothetical protein
MFPQGTARRRAIGEALMMVAGEAAQRKHGPGSVRWWHGLDDLADAWTILSYCCHDREKTDAEFEALKLKARGLMNDHRIWGNVHLIAAALLERGRLSRRELSNLRRRRQGVSHAR